MKKKTATAALLLVTPLLTTIGLTAPAANAATPPACIKTTVTNLSGAVKETAIVKNTCSSAKSVRVRFQRPDGTSYRTACKSVAAGKSVNFTENASTHWYVRTGTC